MVPSAPSLFSVFLLFLLGCFNQTNAQENSHFCKDTIQTLVNTTRRVIETEILDFERCTRVNEDRNMEILEYKAEKGFCKIKWNHIVQKPTRELRNITVDVCCRGWSGENCDQAVCSRPCQHGSKCIGDNKCDCSNTGYQGDDCSEAICVRPCRNGGHCTEPNVCQCSKEYSGKYCEIPVCEPACIHGYCIEPNKCKCFQSYTGPTCAEEDCGGECMNGGSCNQYGQCTCRYGFTGEFCQRPVCDVPCLNGGTCFAPNQCTCPPGFTGATCAINNIMLQNQTSKAKPGEFESIFDAEGYSMCTSWGDRHIVTFDNVYYYFPGKGTYTLFQECQNSEPSFRVHINHTYNCEPGRHCHVELKITNFDTMISVRPDGKVYSNGSIISLPHQVGDLELSEIANYTVVKGIDDLIILYDGLSSVYAFAPPQMLGKLCGLCGQFDGNKTNEFVNYVRKPVATKADFSNVWLDPMEQRTIPAVKEDSVHPCVRLRNKFSKAADNVEAFCSVFSLDYVVFKKCHSTVPPDEYIAMCSREMCTCLLKNSLQECSHKRCEVATQYARACSHHGKIMKWRSNTFCPPHACPKNMVFKECSKNCRQSCGSEGFEAECEEFCVDGCFCKEGTLWDTSTSSCVHRGDCPCYRGNDQRAYPIGTLEKSGCESCTCAEGGRWNCIMSKDCPGICTLSGDPHFQTFDGRQFFFEGECEYVLSQYQAKDGGESFAVWIENKYCNKITDAVCTKVVTIKFGSKNNTQIIRLRSFKVEVNSMSIGLPYKDDDVVIRKVSNILIRLTASIGLDVLWDGRTRIYLKLSNKYQGKVTGMCGNFNNDVNDDNLTPNGENEFNVTKFAMEWKTNTACNSRPSTIYLGACALSKQYEKLATEVCNKMWKEESFKSCHFAVNPGKFVDQCKHDVCMCGQRHGDPRDCECAAFATYARACVLKGITLNWRQSNLCFINCTKGMIYQECGYNCDQTCRGIQPEKCEEECIEGCNCPPGEKYDEEDNVCVPVEECKCYYRNEYYEPKSSRQELCNECICIDGHWQCTTESCNVNDLCSGDMVWSNCSDCIRTCDSLNVDCVATCSQQGCICPEGKVQLNKDSQKCIEPTECPCNHLGYQYKNGDKIKKDCNQCYCKHGTWKCTERHCAATCEAFGDPHYVTFDGKPYNFQGACAYIIAQDFCNETGGTFQVTTENVPCGTLGYSCTKSVKFLIYDTIINLARGTNITYTINNKAPEGTPMANFTIKEVGTYIMIEAHGITLVWDKSMRLYITLENKYMGRVCGLCGNYDQIANNDFRDKSSFPEHTQSPLAFANSWRVRESCAIVDKELPNPCVLNSHRQSWAEMSCRIILGKIFEPCHSSVDPNWYYTSCRDDSCSCDRGGDCQCFCTAVAAYAARCLRAGICINWRAHEMSTSEEVCGIQCPTGREYFPCHSSCPKTCVDFGKKDFICTTGEVEGCFCPNGTYEQDGDCVPISECFCTDPSTGKTYKPGTVVMMNCRKCTCFEGAFRCQEGPGCDTTTQFPSTTTELCVGDDKMFCDGFCATICDGNRECLYDLDEINCTSTTVAPTTLYTTLPTLTSFSSYQTGTGFSLTTPFGSTTPPTTIECKYPYIKTPCKKKCENFCHSVAPPDGCNKNETYPCVEGCDLAPGFAIGPGGPIKELMCSCKDEVNNVTREAYEKWNRVCDICECSNNTVTCTNRCGIITCPPGLELMTPAGKCCPECVPITTTSPYVTTPTTFVTLNGTQTTISPSMQTYPSVPSTTPEECIVVDWMSSMDPLLIPDERIQGYPTEVGIASDARINRPGWAVPVDLVLHPILIVIVATDDEPLVEVLSQKLVTNAKKYAVFIKTKDNEEWAAVDQNKEESYFTGDVLYKFPSKTFIRVLKIVLLEPLVSTEKVYTVQLILNGCEQPSLTTPHTSTLSSTTPTLCDKPNEIHDICRCTPTCEDILAGRECKVKADQIDSSGYCCQCTEGMIYNATGFCIKEETCVCTDDNRNHPFKPHEKFIQKGEECNKECVYEYNCTLECVHICNLESCAEGFELVSPPDECCSCVPITTIAPSAPTTTGVDCHCPSGTFPCHDCSQCLPHHHRCNRIVDCEDGSDEKDCKCLFNGTIYDDGDTWQVNDCLKCQCKSQDAICKKTCPITTCPPGYYLNLYENEDRCCECVQIQSTTPNVPYKRNCTVINGTYEDPLCPNECIIETSECDSISCTEKLISLKDFGTEFIMKSSNEDAIDAFYSNKSWVIGSTNEDQTIEISAKEDVTWVKLKYSASRIRQIKVTFGDEKFYAARQVVITEPVDGRLTTTITFNNGNGVVARRMKITIIPMNSDEPSKLTAVEPYICSVHETTTPIPRTTTPLRCIENETRILNECFNEVCIDGEFQRVPACNKKCADNETLVIRDKECCQCVALTTPVTRTNVYTTIRYSSGTQWATTLFPTQATTVFVKNLLNVRTV
ncbi:mucin-2 [Octopus sinensis]|uniref:Mucin-2 n=1 Tax=Octopus sinensis TaxID=2607531 RepID=A0A6P7SQ26_9MOLL|nr:mucin-2 [Octopus sinensis]